MKRETQYPLAKNALSLIKEAVNHSVKDIKTIYRNLDAEQLDACPRFHGDGHDEHRVIPDSSARRRV